MVLLALLLAGRAAALGSEDYIASLERIRQSLAANQLDVAKSEARALIGQQVDSPLGRFHTDEALLNAVVNASRADHTLQLRLATTIAELRRSAPSAIPASDPKRLSAVAAEQEVPEFAPGGDVPTTLEREVPFMEQIAEAIVRALEWIGEKLGKLIDWLIEFLPRQRRADGKAGDIRWSVIGMVALIVIAVVILAIAVLRRGKSGTSEVAESTEPAGSKRDENPLSRGATEWERYAAQLASEGRHREAIRAWYQAVLVTCYSAGILSFRKGRTNWEYLAMLAPTLPWRAEMIALTRRFEVEWYGHAESSEEALDDCSERASRILESVRRGAREVA
jgi:hypothetical protein